MDQEPRKLGRDEQIRLVTALRVALKRWRGKGIDGTLWRDMLYPANLGLVPENLEQTRSCSPWLGGLLPDGEREPMLLVYPRLGPKEGPTAHDARPAAKGLRLGEVEYGVDPQNARAVR